MQNIKRIFYCSVGFVASLDYAASAPEIRGMKHVDCHLDCSEPSSPLTHTASSSFSLDRRCTAALFRHPPFLLGYQRSRKVLIALWLRKMRLGGRE
ncbi:hypothetical protein Ahy_B08g091314 isoform D [Arachis hypogaea]|uniref:Uncharacterized protein n=1 Tax=Arachis hypogaea TaxID=3818 RepID=A0A444Y1X0_ARAHY|nr:hypothetical protein Ahy_B08g091314 isoform D [Arachis hypogaea]